MANVNLKGMNNRGQLILVTGFALALLFVALALILNLVIYSETLATQGSDGRMSETLEFKQEAKTTALNIRDKSLNDGSDSTDDPEVIGDRIEEWSTQVAEYYAIRGILVDVSVIDRGSSSLRLEIVYQNPRVHYSGTFEFSW